MKDKVKSGIQGRKSSGFTLIELLVVVAVIAVLISVLLPSLNSARKYARTVQCQSNLKQWGMGFLLYMEDYNGHFPLRHPYNTQKLIGKVTWSKDCWQCTVPKYLGIAEGEWNTETNKLACPEALASPNVQDYALYTAYSMSYWLWDYVRNVNKLEQPSKNMLLIDYLGCTTCDGKDFYLREPHYGWPSGAYFPGPSFWHGTKGGSGGAVNFLCCDGRVGTMTYSQLMDNDLTYLDAFWSLGNGGTWYNGPTAFPF